MSRAYLGSIATNVPSGNRYSERAVWPMMPGDDAETAKEPEARQLPIASLAKSLRLLEEIAKITDVASVPTLVARSGLDRTTVQRILRTLVAEGYVERTGRGEYRVAPRGYLLGVMLGQRNHLADAATPALKCLRDTTGEAVHLAVLDGSDVVCIAHYPTKRLLTFNFAVGSRVPAFASSLGRAILAFQPRERATDVFRNAELTALTSHSPASLAALEAELDQIREVGYASATDEVELGVSAIAAPILGPAGEALTAINIVVPTAQVQARGGFDDTVPLLISTAHNLSRSLGWTGASSELAESSDGGR